MHALLVGLATSLFVLRPLADLDWVPAVLPPMVTLATRLAVTGQIFIAVLLARLVSLELAARAEKRQG